MKKPKVDGVASRQGGPLKHKAAGVLDRSLFPEKVDDSATFQIWWQLGGHHSVLTVECEFVWDESAYAGFQCSLNDPDL